MSGTVLGRAVAIASAVAFAVSAAPRPRAHTPAQMPTFRAGRDVVRVDALVTRKGMPVAGLMKDDFEVLDNGVPQAVDLLSFESLPVNAIVALDLSGSVSGREHEQLRMASRALVSALAPGDRAAMVSFTEQVQMPSALTGDLPAVLASVDRTRAGGGTSLFDATYAALRIGDVDTGRTLLVVFSDGFDTSSFLASPTVLDAARRSAVVAYAVMVRHAGLRIIYNGPSGNLMRVNTETAERAYGEHVSDSLPPFLPELAALTGGSVVSVATTKNLDQVFVRILDEFRQRYLLSYTPRGVTDTGWHQITVRLKRAQDKNVEIKARAGYQR